MSSMIYVSEVFNTTRHKHLVNSVCISLEFIMEKYITHYFAEITGIFLLFEANLGVK